MCQSGTIRGSAPCQGSIKLRGCVTRTANIERITHDRDNIRVPHKHQDDTGNGLLTVERFCPGDTCLFNAWRFQEACFATRGHHRKGTTKEGQSREQAGPDQQHQAGSPRATASVRPPERNRKPGSFATLPKFLGLLLAVEASLRPEARSRSQAGKHGPLSGPPDALFQRSRYCNVAASRAHCEWSGSGTCQKKKSKQPMDTAYRSS